MSLNKTLDRLFDEIRREAKRNPAFADRLDAVLRAHGSRRDVSEETLAEELEPASPASSRAKPAPAGKTPQRAPTLNPVGLYRRGGEAVLAAELKGQNEAALRALVVEHNLDPSGAAGGLDREALAAHILAQARRRAERDEKLFDY